MTTAGILQIALFFGLIVICAKPLGGYMARVFEGQRNVFARHRSECPVQRCSCRGAVLFSFGAVMILCQSTHAFSKINVPSARIGAVFLMANVPPARVMNAQATAQSRRGAGIGG